jgi:hypothetical protein
MLKNTVDEEDAKWWAIWPVSLKGRKIKKKVKISAEIL